VVVVAVIHDNQVEYVVVGDTGPDKIIDEASYFRLRLAGSQISYRTSKLTGRRVGSLVGVGFECSGCIRLIQHVPLAETRDTPKHPGGNRYSANQGKGNPMWSAQDAARDQVRRQASGLDMAAVAEKVTEAAARDRETAEQLRRDDSFSEFEMDPERLADVWAAKHVE
ncbi:hypothetical protein ABT168_38645, partial [Streptomyces sp. NPDC001793]